MTFGRDQVKRIAELMLTAQRQQTWRSHAPLACPFPKCYWEASRKRIAPRTLNELRRHLIHAHASALILDRAAYDHRPGTMGTCDNCGSHIEEHCELHTVPCCPGRCSGKD